MLGPSQLVQMAMIMASTRLRKRQRYVNLIDEKRAGSKTCVVATAMPLVQPGCGGFEAPRHHRLTPTNDIAVRSLRSSVFNISVVSKAVLTFTPSDSSILAL
jgi:hypothetical protein